jgi:CheY-like chemotaxis protein
MEKETRLRIMIADDEAVIRMGIQQMIVSLGHQVVGPPPTEPTP